MKTPRRVYLKNKEIARGFVMERIAHFNTVYQVVIKRVSIRNQKTRWGSCSKKGNLNFHHAIVQLPSPLADLVIVHELCHLREFNHSKKFWDLVSQTIPNYKELKKSLRDNTINKIGRSNIFAGM